MATQSWVAILRLRARKLAHQEDPPWQLKTPTLPVATIAPDGAVMHAATLIVVRARTDRGLRGDRRGVALLDPITVRGVTTALRAPTVRSATVRARPTVIGRVAMRRALIPEGVRPRVGRTARRTGRTAMRAPRAMVALPQPDVPLATAPPLETVVLRAAMIAVVVLPAAMIVAAAPRAAMTGEDAPRAAPATAERVAAVGRPRRPTVRHARRSVSARAAPNSPKTSPHAICPPRRAMS